MVRILIRLDDAYCLVGLEHQSYRDKSMFQRNMEYDMLTYLKQYHLYESHHQKINGVMTLTLYYGEEKWNYAKSYLEMMNKIIQGFENYVNVNFYPLIEVASLDEKQFQNKNNKDLIHGLKMLYGKIPMEKELTVSHEVGCLLGALTHHEEIYKHIEKQGGEVNMSEYVLRIDREARQKGQKEGSNEGVVMTLIAQIVQKLGHLSKETNQKIENSSEKQLHNLTLHIFDIESEEDIMKILTDENDHEYE